jgi:hypothetical protein
MSSDAGRSSTSTRAGGNGPMEARIRADRRRAGSRRATGWPRADSRNPQSAFRQRRSWQRRRLSTAFGGKEWRAELSPLARAAAPFRRAPHGVSAAAPARPSRLARRGRQAGHSCQAGGDTAHEMHGSESHSVRFRADGVNSKPDVRVDAARSARAVPGRRGRSRANGDRDAQEAERECHRCHRAPLVAAARGGVQRDLE